MAAVYPMPQDPPTASEPQPDELQSYRDRGGWTAAFSAKAADEALEALVVHRIGPVSTEIAKADLYRYKERTGKLLTKAEAATRWGWSLTRAYKLMVEQGFADSTRCKHHPLGADQKVTKDGPKSDQNTAIAEQKDGIADQRVTKDGPKSDQPLYISRARKDSSQTDSEGGGESAPEEPAPRPAKRTREARPPDSQSVIDHFREKGYPRPDIEGPKMWHWYESNGWRVGRNPMKDWKAAAFNWAQRCSDFSPRQTQTQTRQTYTSNGIPEYT